jgi:hypothetical protein
MLWAQWVLAAAGVYLLLGILFGAVFITRLIERVDHAAKGSGWRFRLLILPGVAALWPLMLRKALNSPREHAA